VTSAARSARSAPEIWPMQGLRITDAIGVFEVLGGGKALPPLLDRVATGHCRVHTEHLLPLAALLQFGRAGYYCGLPQRSRLMKGLDVAGRDIE
jgi:hypothetical protein